MTGGGFAAGESVDISVHSTPVLLKSVTASASGTVDTTVALRPTCRMAPTRLSWPGPAPATLLPFRSQWPRQASAWWARTAVCSRSAVRRPSAPRRARSWPHRWWALLQRPMVGATGSWAPMVKCSALGDAPFIGGAAGQSLNGGIDRTPYSH